MIRLAALLLAALLASTASAQSTTRFSADTPVVNFRLPMFNAAGHRAWLVRGSEARILSKEEIDIRELTMTLFAGDATERIETMILSPVARVYPEKSLATGNESIRVLDDRFEAAGLEWTYVHGDREKRLTIAKQVRVSFRAQVDDILK